MSVPPRKKSPRAPSIALDEALERALRAYDRERLHPAPVDVMAQHLGYKSASSGTSLSAIASLRYFGLLDRPSDGMLAVARSVENYKFAPDDSIKREFLLDCARKPQLYSELLEKYQSALPSDANLRYELIQRGFLPSAAEAAMAAFLRTIQFVDYFRAEDRAASEPKPDEAPEQVKLAEQKTRIEKPADANHPPIERPTVHADDGETIPIRLSGGRRAYLILPPTLFAADKQRIKAQIDLVLTEDED